MPRSPGRPKGSPNKVTAAVKDMVREALDRVGGVEYLMAQSEANPVAFMTLVGKLLPLDVNASIDAKITKIEREIIRPRAIPQNTDR